MKITKITKITEIPFRGTLIDNLSFSFVIWDESKEYHILVKRYDVYYNNIIKVIKTDVDIQKIILKSPELLELWKTNEELVLQLIPEYENRKK